MAERRGHGSPAAELGNLMRLRWPSPYRVVAELGPADLLQHLAANNLRVLTRSPAAALAKVYAQYAEALKELAYTLRSSPTPKKLSDLEGRFHQLEQTISPFTRAKQPAVISAPQPRDAVGEVEVATSLVTDQAGVLAYNCRCLAASCNALAGYWGAVDGLNVEALTTVHQVLTHVAKYWGRTEFTAPAARTDAAAPVGRRAAAWLTPRSAGR